MMDARGGWLVGRWFAAAAVGSALACTVGCAASDDDAATDEPAMTSTSEGELRISDLSDYFLAQPDYRRCAAPVCGGFYVRRLNQARTRCADGTEAEQCYVAHLDGAGMSDAVTGDHVLVRGSIAPSQVHAGWGKLDAREIWTAAPGSKPSGVAYKIEDSGIRCFRAPCATWIAGRLNATTGLYFSSLGSAFASDVQSALAESKHAIVTGSFARTSDGGVAVAATAAYRLAAALPTGPLACSTDADCTTTRHPSVVTRAADCGCHLCPTNVASTSEAQSREDAYTALCSAKQRTCPVARCMAPPPVACVQNVCVTR